MKGQRPRPPIEVAGNTGDVGMADGEERKRWRRWTRLVDDSRYYTFLIPFVTGGRWGAVEPDVACSRYIVVVAVVVYINATLLSIRIYVHFVTGFRLTREAVARRANEAALTHGASYRLGRKRKQRSLCKYDYLRGTVDVDIWSM